MTNPATDDHTHPHSGPHSHSGCCGHDCHDHAASHGHSHATVADGSDASTRRFFLFLELLVLLLWGVVMAWFYASGRIERYLVGEGMFRIQVLIAGMGLFVLGTFNWLVRARAAGCGHDHDHGHEHSHDHDPEHGAGCIQGDWGHSDPGAAHHHDGSFGGRAAALLLMAVPVTAAAAWTADDFSDDYKRNMLHAESSRSAPAGEAPEEYRLAPQSSGANTASAASGGVTLELIEKYQPRNQNGNFDLGVMQLYYSGSDPEYAAVMKGQGVETTGQVVRDTINPGPGRYRVFVLQVSCCAADARPYSIPVELTGPPVEVQEMGWYRVVGTIDYVEERGVTTAVLKAESLQPTVRPRDQRMLF